MSDLLNTSSWRYFKIIDLFDTIEPTKGGTTDELSSGVDVPYIAAKKSENGFQLMCGYDKSIISKGNCIVFINIGEGSAGYSLYQENDFIGMSGKTTCGYNKHLNKYNALFLVTILDKERYRYSYGRSYAGDRLSQTKIKLPCCKKTNKPNWKFMENYIKPIYNTIYSNLTLANNKKNNISELDYTNWKTFTIDELFEIYTGTDLIIKDTPKGVIPLATHSIENNSISDYIELIEDRRLFSAEKTLSVSDRGNFKTFIQNEDFYIGTRVKALEFKQDISKRALLFISIIINKESFRFEYGRNATENIGKIKIKLPMKNNKIDYEFMDSYINSLSLGCLI